MPEFLGPLITGGLNLAGQIFGNTKGARTARFSREEDRSGSFARDETTEPVTSGQFDELSTDLIRRLLQNLDQQPGTIRGIFDEINRQEQTGLEDINSLAERIGRQSSARNTSQGLGFSSASALSEGLSGQVRAGGLSNLLAQLSRLRADVGLRAPQLFNQGINTGTGILRSLPIGTRTSTTGTENLSRNITGTNVKPGSTVGNILEGLADFSVVGRDLFGGNQEDDFNFNPAFQPIERLAPTG